MAIALCSAICDKHEQYSYQRELFELFEDHAKLAGRIN